jgi:lipoprotein NlpD
VRSGDTLFSIAWRNDKDFRELALWNEIRKPYTIYEGQWLRLKPPRQPRKSTPSNMDRKPASPPKPVAQEPKQTKPKVSAPKKQLQKRVGPLVWGWPYKGKVSATFKAGDRLRKGIKIAGKLGAPVLAAESGKVVYSGSGLIGYGRLIIVKHNDKYLSAYGHNRKLLAKQGQQVTKGQQIAELGTSNDGKPLLHFEIRRNGKPVNPLNMLPRR